jgi:hypothetical protein
VTEASRAERTAASGLQTKLQTNHATHPGTRCHGTCVGEMISGVPLVTRKIISVEVSRWVRIFLANRAIALGWALKGSCKQCARLRILGAKGRRLRSAALWRTSAARHKTRPDKSLARWR